MESDPIFKAFRNLTELLSKTVVKSEIPIANNKEELCLIFIEYVKRFSLKNMSEALDIFHRIQGHSDFQLKLECGTAHCAECYYFFCKGDNWNPYDTYCTCNRKISARYRASIENNYKRLKPLKANCDVCGKTKYKMEFTVVSLHKNCVVCLECIKENYIYEKGKRNKCRLCGEVYDEECEFIIRNIYEIGIDPGIVDEFYKDECVRCNVRKDSRKFVQTCQNRDMACQECLDKRDEEKFDTCWCGSFISNLRR